VVGQVGLGPHADRPRRAQEQRAPGLVGVRDRQVEHRLRDDPLGDDVPALEAPPHRGDLADQEEELTRVLGVVPSPPGPPPGLGPGQLAGAHRAVVADLGRDPRHETGPLALQALQPAAGAAQGRLRHEPAHGRVQVDRQERRLVPPPLEGLAGGHQPPGEVARVRAQARQEHQLVRPRDGRDRVELDDPEAVEHRTGMAPVDPARRARAGEAAGGDREPPGLGEAEIHHAPSAGAPRAGLGGDGRLDGRLDDPADRDREEPHEGVQLGRRRARLEPVEQPLEHGDLAGAEVGGHRLEGFGEPLGDDRVDLAQLVGDLGGDGI
jgi:hypothetical protein